MASSGTDCSPLTTSVPGRVAGFASAAVFVLSLTACAGSANRSTATTKPPAASGSPGPASDGPTVTGGPVRGALSAHNHAPIVGKSWRYSVTVTDAAGRPLSGSVGIEFTFAGQVVGHDSPPTHPVKHGRWTDRLTFPAAAVGQPLTFQAVVHTPRGSITLDWPIRVRR